MKIHANNFKVKCPDVCSLASDERDGGKEREREAQRERFRGGEKGCGGERDREGKCSKMLAVFECGPRVYSYYTIFFSLFCRTDFLKIN